MAQDGEGEREICYASLAFDTKPQRPIQRIPPQMRNEHNTNKAIWSARRDKVWSTDRVKLPPRKGGATVNEDEDALGTLPPVRPTKHMLNKQCQTETYRGIQKRQCFLMCLMTIVGVAVLANLFVWMKAMSKRQGGCQGQTTTTTFPTVSTTTEPNCDTVEFVNPNTCNDSSKLEYSFDLWYTSYICSVDIIYQPYRWRNQEHLFKKDLDISVSVSYFNKTSATKSPADHICRESNDPSVNWYTKQHIQSFICKRHKVNVILVTFKRPVKMRSCKIDASGEESPDQ